MNTVHYGLDSDRYSDAGSSLTGSKPLCRRQELAATLHCTTVLVVLLLCVCVCVQAWR